MLLNGFQETWGRGRQERGGAGFQNALFAGDYADPSILRVGDDFYVTHTSYSYAPGLVVWHSRDMVNWVHVSDALTRSYGEVWAPELVEHQGRYYIYFALEGQLSVVHAVDPRGPWSEPLGLGVNEIDPGHVIGPDGARYLYAAGGKFIRLSDDGLSVVGKLQSAYDGWQFPKEWHTEGFWLESPKLTRRGKYYYLTSAEGGTAGPPTSHMAVVARSESPLGPWENSPHNPLIHTYSEDEAWWSVGHGTLVSTPDDRWYIVYHGYRKGFQTLGRHTLMEPIEWTPDDWPVAPLSDKRGSPMPAPMGIAQQSMIPLSDNFKTPDLRPTWSAWRETNIGRFQTGQGHLLIEAKGVSAGQSFPLTVKPRDTHYEAKVVATSQADCGAALGLFYNDKNWLFAELKQGRLQVYGHDKVLSTVPWKRTDAHLKIVNRGNRVDILASDNGRHWQSLLADFDASGFNHNTLGGFQCLRIALASSGAGTARFEDFEYRTL